MASYNAGRPVSPTEDNQLALPQRESAEDLRHSNEGFSHEDARTEQAERLLPGNAPDLEKLGKSEPYAASGRRNWFVRVSSVVIIAIMVMFDIWLVSQPNETRTAPPSAPSLADYNEVPFRRPDTDYILNPNWDYAASSQTRYYNWTILDKDANPDGVFKPMMTINGQFPGPLIEINEGDTIIVNVTNLAMNATAIHWHGLFQNGTNWMDGTAGVTQCPIAPGRSFEYKFTVSGQAGTYFYHGHQGVQNLDGLVGPLVVHGPHESQDRTLPYVSDRVVLLQDWYYDSAAGLMRTVLSPGSEDSPIPNAALMNGLNQVNCSLHPGRRCDPAGTRFPSMVLAPNSNHKLRFINLGGYAWFQVSVDDHTKLPVVEIDGTPVESTTDGDIVLAPGQRYTAILTTDQGAPGPFWLRARMIKSCFAEPSLPENGTAEAKAVIRYGTVEEDSQALPTTENTNTKYPMICRDMTSRHQYHPSPALPAPEVADHSWYLRVNLEIGDWRLQRGVMNSSSFRPNLSSPTLHRYVDGLATANESFISPSGDAKVNTEAFDPKHELVLSHGRPEVVDVVLQNMDENSHPFHLHGHQFWVLAAGHGYFPGYAALNLRPSGAGLLDPANRTIVANPLRRDVATAEGFGWVLLRFVADNPGVWLFHCHMVWHSEAGMGLLFASRVDDMKGWSVPPESRRMCEMPEVELRKGAPPPDEIFFGFHDDTIRGL